MILDDTKKTMVPMDTEPENGDYKGEDGHSILRYLPYAERSLFPGEERSIFGRDRHPSECECRRKERGKEGS